MHLAVAAFACWSIVYYVGADLYLIDRNVLDVPQWGAILISMASIVLGWVIYDRAVQIADRARARTG